MNIVSRIGAWLASIHRGQKGITGLETAIILIAFVVVAFLMGFTVLSSDVLSAEEDGETMHVGLQGSVIETMDGANSQVGIVTFTIANTAAGEPLDLTEPTDADDDGIPDSGSSHKMVIAYSDMNRNIADMMWSRTWLGDNDGDNLLELGEKAQITAQVGLAVNEASGTNLADAEFTLEFKPPEGAVLVVQCVMPSTLDIVKDLK